MGKKNKKMIHKVNNNVLARKEFEKENERLRAVGDIQGCYDSLIFYDDKMKKQYADRYKNKVNLFLLKNIVFSTISLPKNYKVMTMEVLVKEMTQTGVFASIKPKASYKKGVITEVKEEVQKCIMKACPTLFEETFELFVKTVAIIFEYDKEFRDEITSDNEKFETWCFSLLERSLYFILIEHSDRRIVELNKNNKAQFDGFINDYMPISEEEIKNILSVDNTVDFKKDMYKKFIPEYFVSLKSDEFKEILTEQINNFYDYSFENQGKNLDELEANYSEGVTAYSYEAMYGESEYDLSTYVKISRENLKRTKDINFDAFSGLESFEIIQRAVSLVAGSETRFLEELFMNLIVDLRVTAFLKHKDLIFSAHREKSDKEVKDLTSQVRTLKKDFSKLEKNFEDAEKKIKEYEESNKVEIEDTQVILEKSEVEGYQKQIEDLKTQILDDKDNYSKVSNKNSWQENRIKELEEKLKYYSSLENDMMSLQNEMNILSAQVDKLEEMGQEDEDVKQKRFEEHLNAIKDLPILFVGGTGNMMSKFMPLFPNSDYIDISDEGVNFTVPQRFAYVVVYTRVVTHSHCARVESLVDKDKIIPVNIFNTELVVEELYKNIIGHKK